MLEHGQDLLLGDGVVGSSVVGATVRIVAVVLLVARRYDGRCDVDADQACDERMDRRATLTDLLENPILKGRGKKHS